MHWGCNLPGPRNANAADRSPKFAVCVLTTDATAANNRARRIADEELWNLHLAPTCSCRGRGAGLGRIGTRRHRHFPPPAARHPAHGTPYTLADSMRRRLRCQRGGHAGQARGSLPALRSRLGPRSDGPGSKHFVVGATATPDWVRDSLFGFVAILAPGSLSDTDQTCALCARSGREILATTGGGSLSPST